MNTVDKIRAGLDTMTRSERLVASWLLGHPGEIAFLTLDRMAQEIGTSTTSVLRFCRRLGFSGFKDFQASAQKELRRQPDLTDKFRRTARGQTEDALLEEVFGKGIRCLQDTFAGLEYKSLKQAVKLLTDARRVFTFGMKESHAMAHYAYTRLLTVRRDVYLLDAGDNAEAILSLTPHDVCVVFLFHRYTKATLQRLPLLRAQGVPVILITSPPAEEVARYASALLPCHVDGGGIKNTFAAPAAVCDYLCNAVAVAEGDNAMTYMKETEELFRCGSVLGDETWNGKN